MHGFYSSGKDALKIVVAHSSIKKFLAFSAILLVITAITYYSSDHSIDMLICTVESTVLYWTIIRYCQYSRSSIG